MILLPDDHPLHQLKGNIIQVYLEEDGTVVLVYDNNKLLYLYEDEEGFTLGVPEDSDETV